MDNVIYRGSCLCGTVGYAVSAQIKAVSHCHCSMCRKAHGTAFATYASVPRDKHAFTKGLESLRRFKSSEKVTRTFCVICGSPLLWHSEGPFADRVAFPLGTLDTESAAPKQKHIHVASKATWYQIEDHWPQAEEY